MHRHYSFILKEKASAVDGTNASAVMDFPIDHDLHCHTRLSLCSCDPGQTPAAILAHAKAHGYWCRPAQDGAS